MGLRSLEDLLLRELEDLFSAEDQLAEALPQMVGACRSVKLREVVEEHLQQTLRQRDHLRRIIQQLGRSPGTVRCQAMEGILAEGKELIREDVDPMVRDAGLIAAAQRAEHYMIAGYGTARTFADMLGYEEASKVLQEILDAESEANEVFTELAITEINIEALKIQS